MVNLGLLHDQPTSVEQTRASGPRSKLDTEAMLWEAQGAAQGATLWAAPGAIPGAMPWATLGATLSAMQSAMQSARRSLAC